MGVCLHNRKHTVFANMLVILYHYEAVNYPKKNEEILFITQGSRL